VKNTDPVEVRKSLKDLVNHIEKKLKYNVVRVRED